MLRQLGRKEEVEEWWIKRWGHPSSGANWISMFIQIESLFAQFTYVRALQTNNQQQNLRVYSGYTEKDGNNVNQMSMWRLTMIAVAVAAEEEGSR